MSNTAPCRCCSLRYSSYCIGCQFVKYGLGLSAKEYEEHLRRKDNGTIKEE